MRDFFLGTEHIINISVDLKLILTLSLLDIFDIFSYG